MNNFDHALARWRQATARLEALEKGRFAFAFQSWVGAAEIRAYDQQIAAARVVKDQAFSEYKIAKQAAPASRPVKITPKHTPVTLPSLAPRITPAQRAALERQRHAAQDVIAWKLFGAGSS